jgi:hypothetical protein
MQVRYNVILRETAEVRISRSSTERERDFAFPSALKTLKGRIQKNEKSMDCIGSAGDDPGRQSSVGTTQDGLTMGGHIGFVLPLVTRSGSQTINNTADQFSIGFPVGVTFKGGARMAFDLELIRAPPCLHVSLWLFPFVHPPFNALS